MIKIWSKSVCLMSVKLVQIREVIPKFGLLEVVK